MTKVSLSLPLLPHKRTYFPQGNIASVVQQFKALPHEEAVKGKLLATDSAKDVRAVSLGEEVVAVKIWNQLTLSTRQAAVNELVGRIFANYIKASIQGIGGAAEHIQNIIIPSAIAYETGDKVVLVSQFFDGCHLDTKGARDKEFPTGAKAIGPLIPMLSGAHQFPTSSFLCKKDKGMEVALIDWESVNGELGVDYPTQVLFCLLRAACEEDGTIEEFDRTLTECGNRWYEVVHSNENLQKIADAIDLETGILSKLSLGLSTPQEMVQHLLKVADYYKVKGFTLQEEHGSFASSITEVGIQSSINQPILDEEEALHKCGGDHELLKELIDLFLSESTKWLGSLRAAVKEMKFSEIRRNAHSIKGAVSLFCRENELVLKTVLTLEAKGQEQDPVGVEEHYKKLELEIMNLNKALTVFKGKL